MHLFIVMSFLLFQAIAVVLAANLFWSQIYNKKNEKAAESLAVMAIFVALLDISAAFLLALVNQYKLVYLLFITIALVVIVGVFQKNVLTTSILIFKDAIRHANKLMIAFLTVVLFLYSFFPTYYLWGRRDPGVYLTEGVNIATTGSVHLPENDYINVHYEELQEIVDLEYRGVYSDYEEGDSDKPGKVTIQFLHYFPSALAIGYSLAGLEGLVRVNSIIGVLTLLAIYYFCKAILGRSIATVSTVLVGINPAQIWCARITQTELLFQLVTFLGLYTAIMAYKRQRYNWGWISGLLFGITGLNRMDAYILGVGVLCCSCISNLWGTKYRGIAGRIAIGYVLAAGASLGYSYIFSKYYIVQHWEEGVLFQIVVLNIILILCALLTDLLGRIKIIKRHNLVLQLCNSTKARTIFCLVLTFAAIFAYYVRPLFQEGVNADADFNCRALVELCWYTTPIAIPLLLFALWCIMQETRLLWKGMLFWLVGFSNLIIYIYRPAIAPDHIWASRRWVSVCIPFVIIMAATGCYTLAKLLGSSQKSISRIMFAVGGVCAVYFLFQSRAFLFTSMLSEFPKQYAALAKHMDDDSLYIAQQSHFGTILRFVYGKNVVVLPEDVKTEDIIEVAKTSEMPVYYIGDQSAIGNSSYFNTLSEMTLEGTYLKEENGKYATQRQKIVQEVDIVSLGLSGVYKQISDDAIQVYPIISSDESDDSTKKKSIKNNTTDVKEGLVTEEFPITTAMRAEGYFAIYGPYLDLSAGQYRATFTLELLNPDDSPEELGTCDVSTGGNILVEQKLRKSDFVNQGSQQVTLDFGTGMNRLTGVEFRLYVEPGVQFRVTDISYQCTGLERQAILPGTEDYSMLLSVLGYDTESLPLQIAVDDAMLPYVSCSQLQEELGRAHEVSLVGISEMVVPETPTILLVPADETELLFDLLPRDTVLVRLNEYAVVVPSGYSIERNFVEAGGRTLSDGDRLNVRYFQGTGKSNYGSINATIPAGEYDLSYRVDVLGTPLWGDLGTLSIRGGGVNVSESLSPDMFTYGVYEGSRALTMEDSGQLSMQLTTRSGITVTRMEAYLSRRG